MYFKDANGNKMQVTKKDDKRHSVEGYKSSPAQDFFGTIFSTMGIGIVVFFIILALIIYACIKKS